MSKKQKPKFKKTRDPMTPNKQKYLELCQKRAKANSELAKKRYRRPKTGITFVPCGDASAAYLVQRKAQQG